MRKKLSVCLSDNLCKKYEKTIKKFSFLEKFNFFLLPTMEHEKYLYIWNNEKYLHNNNIQALMLK